MNGADYLILTILLVTTLLGLTRGFLRESVALLAWLGGLWLAWRYAHLLTPHLGGLLGQEPARTWAARALVMTLVLLAGWFVGALLSHLARQSALSALVDRLMGLFFGLAKGLVLISVLIIVGQLVRLDQVQWWQHSRLMPFATEVSRWIRNFAETGSTYLDKQADQVEA
jgi:membrane protein required for colicin V production